MKVSAYCSKTQSQIHKNTKAQATVSFTKEKANSNSKSPKHKNEKKASFFFVCLFFLLFIRNILIGFIGKIFFVGRLYARRVGAAQLATGERDARIAALDIVIVGMAVGGAIGSRAVAIIHEHVIELLHVEVVIDRVRLVGLVDADARRHRRVRVRVVSIGQIVLLEVLALAHLETDSIAVRVGLLSRRDTRRGC